MYILCDKCNLILATIWVLYPEQDNVIKLTCHRQLEDGSYCGNVVKVSTKELLKTKGSNKPQQLPETLL